MRGAQLEALATVFLYVTQSVAVPITSPSDSIGGKGTSDGHSSSAISINTSDPLSELLNSHSKILAKDPTDRSGSNSVPLSHTVDIRHPPSSPYYTAPPPPSFPSPSNALNTSLLPRASLPFQWYNFPPPPLPPTVTTTILISLTQTNPLSAIPPLISECLAFLTEHVQDLGADAVIPPNDVFGWLGANAVRLRVFLDHGVTWGVLKEAVGLVEGFMSGEGWTRAEFKVLVHGRVVGMGIVG
ncbi:hypothetical protein MMC14_001954 [Varicellaria rhodocarpa]|nr:hypothetical protein [Varicellaria rhodocarpa]